MQASQATDDAGESQVLLNHRWDVTGDRPEASLSAASPPALPGGCSRAESLRHLPKWAWYNRELGQKNDRVYHEEELIHTRTFSVKIGFIRIELY